MPSERTTARHKTSSADSTSLKAKKKETRKTIREESRKKTQTKGRKTQTSRMGLSLRARSHSLSLF
jgi:hypothetical protein